MVPLLWAGAIAIHAGAAFWFTGAPTAEGTRRGFIRHTQGVLASLQEDGQIPAGKINSLRDDIALLQQKASTGWTEPYEHAAFLRVSGFVTSSHLQGTGKAIGRIADNYLGALVDMVRKPMNRPPTDEARHC